MIRILDVPSAEASILQRNNRLQNEYPGALLDSIESIFDSRIGPEEAVRRILISVQQDGDRALQDWSRRLDRSDLTDFRLQEPLFTNTLQALAPDLRSAMLTAADRIRAFHALQPIPEWETDSLGGRIGQRITPIQRVGVYVPGGSAPLPSSLLMSVIPAQIAGVREIVVCTPPDPHPSILAAAALCGLEIIYQVGGSQAIAALAFGTDTIPRVDKIVGAGNLFVTLAKQQVFGIVGLDGLAGPTETMIIADAAANAAWIASDLLAQAEHDPLATAILLTPDKKLACAVQDELQLQLAILSRAEIITQSLQNNGGIILTPDLASAARLADSYAPEHLELLVADPTALMQQIQNAGGFFLGEASCEVLGDYVAGPSHVMPTGGSARFSSPLNVLDFVKISSVVALDSATCRALAPLAERIATEETLSAHAAAARKRYQEE